MDQTNRAVTGVLNNTFSTTYLVPTRNPTTIEARTYSIVNSDGDVDVRRDEPVRNESSRYVKYKARAPPSPLFGWGS